VDRPSGTVHYYFSDHLGSASVLTDASGTVQEQYFYYPYGGLQSSIGSDSNHYKFTGKERDAESGLDNFGARYDSSNLGRFMTPDWAAKPTDVPYANFGNPQSLNLYSYVQNNPTTMGDPDGHLNSNDFHCGVGRHCMGDGPLIGNSCDDTAGSRATGNWSHDFINLLALVTAGQAQNQQGSSCGFLCKLFHTDRAPARYVILYTRTENKGSFSYFYYHLENKEGQKLTRNGYSVKEHISPSAGMTTSEDRFVPLNHGVSQDAVGEVGIDANSQLHSITLPTFPNADLISEQTFTVKYNEQEYNLTTQFEHETRIVNGVATNTVIDVVP